MTSLAPLDITHYPVMLKEVIELCELKKGGNFIDCTFGGGGYSSEILKSNNTKVIALDRDKFVEKKAIKLKEKYENRFTFFHEKFSNLDQVVNKNLKIDKIIMDLGVSSFQLKDMSRGFSFNSEDRLDMSMGLSSISAEDVINDYEAKDLKLIIKTFGDEKDASRIVKNIIKERQINRISTVKDLVKIIEKSKKKNYLSKINISTKTFQALRIFVNKETTELLEAIIKASQIVKSGGKIIIVSFHSIEDRIVKFFFTNYSSNRSRPSRYEPCNDEEHLILFNDYKKNLIRPSKEEIEKNPPSRSAKLRFVTRNEKNFTYPKSLKLKFKKYLDIEKINA